MLTLNIDLFNLKIFAILGLIIFTTIAIIKNAKTFHFSFQTWTWPFRAMRPCTFGFGFSHALRFVKDVHGLICFHVHASLTC